ncbi:hemerythrin domain-containing protein [Roseovarius sp. ZX-A-9]|uniref:hemerythrin domain-containing protein n=1 Tax=Roseovarius sp. ZX-A-9 TaxID=3014783 RepID=UPI00233065CF|nr:hemerythrin domain-containing protein [Roseovarius sp. ZX-A-9]
MTQTLDIRRNALPEDMRFLLRDYPREAWPENPHFARSIQNWMSAHVMFRQLGELNRSETELYLTKARSPDDFAARLSHYGNLLVRNLHGHHTWEDRSFFPELEGADPRFAGGLEMLESDHAAMDEVLDRFTDSANRVVKLIQLDEGQAREETKALHDTTAEIEQFLARHLADEEDLVVPILLHHKMRG